MEITKTMAIYFSPTTNTRRMTLAAAKGVASVFGTQLHFKNWARPRMREQDTVFDSQTLAVVGMPTYAGRLPNLIAPSLKAHLKGNKTPAIAVVTYGNRDYENSLAELVDLLSNNGFIVVAALAAPCAHAFADIGTGRPSDQDLMDAIVFGQQVGVNLAQVEYERQLKRVAVPGDPAAPYYRPLKADGTPANFLKAKPEVGAEKCTGCSLCVRLCPMGSVSINPVSGKAEIHGVCIKCQACLRGCEPGALSFTDPEFLAHKAMLEANYTEKKDAAVFPFIIDTDESI